MSCTHARLKKPRDIDKWSSLRLFYLRECHRQNLCCPDESIDIHEYRHTREYMYLQNINLFTVLHRLQICTGHITLGSFVGSGKQYIQLVKVLYCK